MKRNLAQQPSSLIEDREMESISLFIQAKWQKDTQIQILLFALFSIGSCF